MINYYVAYRTEKFHGGIFMETNFPYETKIGMEALINYLSKEYANGQSVIIQNLIRLDGEA